MNKSYIIAVLRLVKSELLRANRTTGYGSADPAFTYIIYTLEDLIKEFEK